MRVTVDATDKIGPTFSGVGVPVAVADAVAVALALREGSADDEAVILLAAEAVAV